MKVFCIVLLLLVNIFLIRCSYEWSEGGNPRIYANIPSSSTENDLFDSNNINKINKNTLPPPVITNINDNINIADNQKIDDSIVCAFLNSDELGFKQIANIPITYLCANNFAGLKEIKGLYNFGDFNNVGNIKAIDRFENGLSYLDVYYGNKIHGVNIKNLIKLSQYYCLDNGSQYWNLINSFNSLSSSVNVFKTFNVQKNSCDYELEGNPVGYPELGLSWKFHYGGHLVFATNKAKTLFAEANYVTKPKPNGVIKYLMNFIVATQHDNYIQLYNIKLHVAELSVYSIVHNEAKKIILEEMEQTIFLKKNLLKKIHSSEQ